MKFVQNNMCKHIKPLAFMKTLDEISKENKIEGRHITQQAGCRLPHPHLLDYITSIFCLGVFFCPVLTPKHSLNLMIRTGQRVIERQNQPCFCLQALLQVTQTGISESATVIPFLCLR